MYILTHGARSLIPGASGGNEEEGRSSRETDGRGDVREQEAGGTATEGPGRGRRAQETALQLR